MSMTTRSVHNALPKLPGFNFPELSQIASYGLTQTFVPIAGAAGNCTIPRDMASLRMTTNHGASSDPSRSVVTEAAILRRFPLWKTLDDKVLRFFGYFTEKVEESMTERGHDVVHKVVVLFFLSDRSVQVSERPSGANSGLRAGSIMSKFYDHGADPFTWRIGDTVKLRGRAITLVDCDAFTRDFFNIMGMSQPERTAAAASSASASASSTSSSSPKSAPAYPTEFFETLVTANNSNAAANRRGVAQQQQQQNNRFFDDEDYKQGRRAAEMLAVVAKQMPAPQFMSAEEKRNAQMFLLHDKEVLNFYAVWARRHFRISFFLSDGTMCVNSLKAANDGRDPVANFLKRGKISKGPYMLKSIDTVAAPRQVAQEYYTETDLTTGTSISINGRDFHIYDCDEFTRDYYRRTYGIELASGSKPETEGDDTNPFGKRPQLDRTEEFRNRREAMKPPTSDAVLRFAAVIDSEVPQDQGRQFVFCFFCCDNTVAVNELPVRNSGHVGGKIFSRAKVDSVTREQLVEGAVVKLGAHKYRLIASDERTKAYDNVPRSPPSSGAIESRATEILDRLRQQISQRWSRVSDAYLHFNTSKHGITLSDLKNMLRECEIRISTALSSSSSSSSASFATTSEAAILARVMERVDRDNDGVISLQEFVSNILRQSLIGGTTADTVQQQSSSQAQSQSKTPTQTTATAATAKDTCETLPPMQANAALRLAKLDAERKKQAHANKILETFVAKLDARRAFIVDAFRFVTDRSADGKIGVDCFRKVVAEKMGMQLSPQDLDALVYRFFAVEGIEDFSSRRISLREFRRVLSGGWSGAAPES